VGTLHVSTNRRGVDCQALKRLAAAQQTKAFTRLGPARLMCNVRACVSACLPGFDPAHQRNTVAMNVLGLRFVLLFLISVALLFAASLPARADEVAAFFKTHCIDCHGPDAQQGGLRLDALSLDAAKVGQSADALRVLLLLHDRVRDGEMPPRDVEQPSTGERQKFLAALAPVIIDAEKQAAGGARRTTIRRMNRVEYENTLRDLFSLPSLRVKELLPEDGREHGFDKVAGALDISYVQMQKYLEAATVAVDQALPSSIAPPKRTVWREPAMDQHSARAAINQKCLVPINGRELAPGYVTGIAGDPVNDIGNSYRWASFKGTADSCAVLTGVIGAHQPEGIQIDRFKPPVAGLYKVRFSIWGLRWERTKAGPARPGLTKTYASLGKPYFKNGDGKWQATPSETKDEPTRVSSDNLEIFGEGDASHVVRLSLHGRPLGYFDALSLKPTTHELTVWLAPGDRLSFHAMTLPASGPSGSGISDGVRDYEGPGIAYDFFEVEGPLDETWPPLSQRRLFGETPIEKFPRPVLASRPTVGSTAASVTVSHREFAGDGHKLDDQWLLNVTGEIATTINFAAPGTYEFRVTAYQTPAGDEPAELWTLLDGREMPHGRFKIEAERDQPQTIRRTFEVSSAGPATIGVRFPNDFFDETTKADRNLGVTRFEIAPVKLRSVDGPVTPEPATLLRDFASRAFRRPVEPAEVEPFLTIVHEQLQAGESFKYAMLAGYRAILCSPDFLFLGLEDSFNNQLQVSPTSYAIASRLSYFLWDSLPDDALLERAATGELTKHDVLLAQVDRMLADPRSDRFVEHFLDEWLQLRDIDFTTPDGNLYPEFDPWLRDSMLAETRGFFRQLLDQNHSASELIDSDTLFINQRLALLYGIPGVQGADFRECKVPDNVPRGGLLTQAAVLKVTANGTATSPVLRGVWVMERLLGIPRLPPPPNIPAIEPDATGATTIRQMVEQHRADNACAVCHNNMDPYGLALESFNPIGGFRDRYRLSGKPKKTRRGNETIEEPSIEVVSVTGHSYRNRLKIRLGSEVDPSGVLADGRSFHDISELRKLLLSDPDAIARNVCRQLVIYATGSGIRFSDRDEISRIVAKTKTSDHGLRSIVREVVLSELFR
jgi:hypothetical protein